MIDNAELTQLKENLRAVDDFVEVNTSKDVKEIQESDLNEGETLALLLDSQIPDNYAEIVTRNNQTSLVSENLQIHDLYKTLKWKLIKVQDHIRTQIEILQLSDESELLNGLFEILELSSRTVTKLELNLAATESIAPNTRNNAPIITAYNEDYPSYQPLSTTSYNPIPARSHSFGSKPAGPNMVNIMYILRRTGDRNETNQAVEQLIEKLIDPLLQENTTSILEMREAAALETLFSALNRCSTWPEVEIQVAKAIAILVTYEDPDSLLKNCFNILSSLYTLQVKCTQIGNDMNKDMTKMKRSGRHSTGSIERVYTEVVTVKESNIDDVLSFQPSPSKSNTINNKSDTTYTYGNTTKDPCTCTSNKPDMYNTNTLVANALSKLIFALCEDWKKNNLFPSLTPSGGPSLGQVSGVYRTHMPYDAVGYRPPTPSPLDASHMGTLNTILNLIMTIYEPYLQSVKSQMSFATTTVMNKYNLGISPLSSSTPKLFSMNDTKYMMNGPPNKLNYNTYKDDFYMNSGGSPGSSSSSPAVSMNFHADCFMLSDTSVAISATICCLTELPHCRSSLILGGVLKLLRIWLEHSYFLLSDIRKRLDPDQNDTSYSLHSNCNCLNNVCDLLSNTTRAIMYIVGGSYDIFYHLDDYRPNTTLNVHTSMDHNTMYRLPHNSQNNRRYSTNNTLSRPPDSYEIGRTDGDFMTENIPSKLIQIMDIIMSITTIQSKYASILKTSGLTSPLVSPGQSSSTKLPGRNKSDPPALMDPLTTLLTEQNEMLMKVNDIIQSKHIMLYITQTLYQLCSRPQNRSHLLIVDTPQILISLFHYTIMESKKMRITKADKGSTTNVNTTATTTTNNNSNNNSSNMMNNDIPVKRISRATSAGTYGGTGSSSVYSSSGRHPNGGYRGDDAIASLESMDEYDIDSNNSNYEGDEISKQFWDLLKPKTYSQRTTHYNLSTEYEHTHGGGSHRQQQKVQSRQMQYTSLHAPDSTNYQPRVNRYTSIPPDNVHQKGVEITDDVLIAWRNSDNTNTDADIRMKTINHSHVNIDLFVKAMAIFTLDSLSYFLSDALVSRVSRNSVSYSTTKTLLLPDAIHNSQLTGTNTSMNTHAHGLGANANNNNTLSPLFDLSSHSTESKVNFTSGNAVVDMLCEVTFINDVKFLLSNIPRGMARLSLLRVTSTLSEWPTAASQFSQYNELLDAFIAVTTQSDTLKRLKIDFIKSEKVDTSGSKTIVWSPNKQISSFQAKPAPVTSGFRGRKFSDAPALGKSRFSDRGLTGGGGGGGGEILPLHSTKTPERYKRSASEASDISNHSHHSTFSNHSRTSLFSGGNKYSSFYPTFIGQDTVSEYSDHIDSYDDEQDIQRNKVISTEETIYVSTTLANICQTSTPLAKKLFEKGLLYVMLELSKSLHIDVMRNSLRCISAICPVMTQLSLLHEKNESNYTKIRMNMFEDTLNTLINTLNHRIASTHQSNNMNILILREALIAIAGLSSKQKLHEKILEIPVRTIIRLTLDRNNVDRETKTAADEILKNIGFRGGLNDLELISYDITVLNDWYKLKQNFKPQDDILLLTQCWILDLFEHTTYYTTYRSDNKLPHLHQHEEDSIFRTQSSNNMKSSAETINIRAPMTMQSAREYHSMNSSLTRNTSEPVLDTLNCSSYTDPGYLSRIQTSVRGSRDSYDPHATATTATASEFKNMNNNPSAVMSPTYNAFGTSFSNRNRSKTNSDHKSLSFFGLFTRISGKNAQEEQSPTLYDSSGYNATNDPHYPQYTNNPVHLSTSGNNSTTTTTSNNNGSSSTRQRGLTMNDSNHHYSHNINNNNSGGGKSNSGRSNERKGPTMKIVAESLIRIMPYSLNPATWSTKQDRNLPSYEESVTNRDHDLHVNGNDDEDGDSPSDRPRSNTCEVDSRKASQSTTTTNNNTNMNKHIHSLNTTSDATRRPDGSWISLDSPPAGVYELLDKYHPSRIHQLFYMDMTSLHSRRVLQSHVMHDASISFDTWKLDDILLELPKPNKVRGIFFEPRPYPFSRMQRIVERLVDEGGPENKWSIAFREDSFTPEGMSDFHEALQNMLSKCPQIVSLSFTCSHLPSTGGLLSFQKKHKESKHIAHLGHMAGHIPASVRVLNFRGVLSSDSIQAFFIILKKNNYAYTNAGLETNGGATSRSPNEHTFHSQLSTPIPDNAYTDDTSPHARKFSTVEDGHHLGRSLNSTPSLIDPSLPLDKTTYGSGGGVGGSSLAVPVTPGSPQRAKSPPSTSVHTSSPRSIPSYGLRATPPRNSMDIYEHFRSPKFLSKGLLGLAITHTTFSKQDLQYLLDVLAVYGMSTAVATAVSSGGGLMSPATPAKIARTSSVDHTPLYGALPRGIRFLDVSSNKFGDEYCRDVFVAALHGPLEGLDLSGNSIKNGPLFLEAFHQYACHKFAMNSLLHLRLAENHLSEKFIIQLLLNLRENRTLVTLDISHNDIQSTCNEAIRLCLKENRGLRVLDLSYNKLNDNTVEEMYLGMLENETILLLPLSHNGITDNSSKRMAFIQVELRKNRDRYKREMKEYNARCQDYITTLTSFHSIAEDDSLQNIEPMIGTYTSTSSAYSSTHGDNNNNNSSSNDLLARTQVALNSNSSDENDGIKTTKTYIPIANPINNVSDTANNMSISTAVKVGDSQHLLSEDKTRYSSSSKMSDTDVFSDSMPSSRYSDRNYSNRPSVETSTQMTTLLRKSLLGPGSGLHSAEEKSLDLSESNMKVMNGTTTHVLTTITGSSASLTTSKKPSSSSSSGVFHVFFSSPLAYPADRDYHPLEKLDYESERDTIIQVLTRVHRDISISFQFATTNNLRTALSLGCKALHFSGHGHPSYLSFENDRGGLHPVNIEALRSLLTAGGTKLDFVFVSACQSRRIGDVFLEVGVPHVVCVKVDEMIQDSAAKEFTRAFYVALFDGKPLVDAFMIAKSALQASPYVSDSILEGEKFVLLPEDDPAVLTDTKTYEKSIHKRRIFKCSKVPEWPTEKHIITGSNYYNFRASTELSLTSEIYVKHYQTYSFPSPLPDFVGREVDLCKVIDALFKRRLVSLVGPPGIGKTAMTKSLCAYVADRNMFSDGILYVATSSITNYHQFLFLLLDSLFLGPLKVRQSIQQIDWHLIYMIVAIMKLSYDAVEIPSKNRNFYMNYDQFFPHSHGSHTSTTTTTTTSNGMNIVTSNMSTATTIISNNDSGATTPIYPLTSTSTTTATSTSSLEKLEQITKNVESMEDNERMYHQEKFIITCLKQLNLLLVIDHIDDLLSQGSSETIADFKLFIGKLLEQCSKLKLLVTSVIRLGLRQDNGIVETCYELGSLTLLSTVRLYARLSSCLNTSAARAEFVKSFLPSRKHHVTYRSRDSGPQSDSILELFGRGDPSEVVNLAWQSTQEIIENLKNSGRRILCPEPPEYSLTSPDSIMYTTWNTNNSTHEHNNNHSNHTTSNMMTSHSRTHALIIPSHTNEPTSHSMSAT